MSEKLPPLMPHISKSWLEWISTIENTDSLKGNELEENQGNATQLPRSDLLLYGIYPKMEPRVYVVCNDCSKVIRPYDVSSHTNLCKADRNAEKEQPETPSSSNAVKKKSSQTKSKKKSVLPANVPPPPLFPWFSTQCAKEGAAAAPSGMQTPPCGSESGSNTSSHSSTNSSSSSKSHKKTKKQTSKGSSSKEQETEKHGTLADKEKGSHKHSSRSSHHSGSGKKVLSSSSSSSSSKSSKSVHHHHHHHHHSGAEKKHVKDAIKPVVSQYISIIPKSTAPETVTTTAADNVVVSTSTSTIVADTPCEEAITSKAEATTMVQSNLVQSVVTATVSSSKLSPKSDTPGADTVPIVLMPMSPVAVVSPIQVIQLSVPVLHVSSPQQTPSPPLPTQPIVVSICDQNNSVKLYNTHPKPLILPTMANRKIGNTILLQSQRIEHQRCSNKIDMALNCKTLSLLNTMHKPNILKCRGMKMNMKRSAAEKLATNECKQTRLTPDVNGFILHADVSESAEAPQPDNSIHEKIALMNMK